MLRVHHHAYNLRNGYRNIQKMGSAIIDDVNEKVFQACRQQWKLTCSGLQ